ncbi:sulfotransferase [Streptomyces sp. NPDC050738]|uniref:sulfotransferase family protein n=1 Tax=Streptomyces sp. NPDC050738 TaxID=3154744 RepID=UPI00344280BA
MPVSDPRLRAAVRRARRGLYALNLPGGRPPRAAPAPTGQRLVPEPVFVISSVRSGSTLLRVLLNSHPRIRAPHEMHLRTLQVDQTMPYTKNAMTQLGLDQQELEHLLWDRVLHRELEHSGKDVIVDKTPGNALVWDRLHEAWPDAKFLFLLRHPASMVSSLINGRPDRDPAQTVAEFRSYVDAVEDAGATTRDICGFLGVEWDRRMLQYGKKDHGPFKAFIGDWSENIKSGSVQPARALPAAADVPEELRATARGWGYAC